MTTASTDQTDHAIDIAISRDEAGQPLAHDRLGWLLHLLADDIEQLYAAGDETFGRAWDALDFDMDTIVTLTTGHPDERLILATLAAIDGELAGDCFTSRGMADQHQTALRRVAGWIFRG